jgi:hypothetical protein
MSPCAKTGLAALAHDLRANFGWFGRVSGNKDASVPTLRGERMILPALPFSLWPG